MALAAAVCCFSSCMTEKIDTLVQWGFAKDTESNITNGLETMLPSAVTIFDAFDKAFYGDYAKLGSGHEANMQAQQSTTPGGLPGKPMRLFHPGTPVLPTTFS